uniref:Uncharacterized protein LOC111103528 n=1 Tax=Crassostrea virginica TaxID=6565 RepID=A0A8B8AQW9_CRAVI|nr:uncharacterized protein LOC111103528 [Crassostrea virginica]
MARVEACPKNLTKVIEASKRLGCKNDEYGNNQYLCLPNVDNTSLVEFCYGGIMGFQKKGNCVQASKGNLTHISCVGFSSGCPETHFITTDFYKYPACQDLDLDHHCYKFDPYCSPKNDIKTRANFTTTSILAVSMGLVIPIAVLFVLYCYCRRKQRRRHKYAEDQITTNAEYTQDKNGLSMTEQKSLLADEKTEDLESESDELAESRILIETREEKKSSLDILRDATLEEMQKLLEDDKTFATLKHAVLNITNCIDADTGMDDVYKNIQDVLRIGTIISQNLKSSIAEVKVTCSFLSVVLQKEQYLLKNIKRLDDDENYSELLHEWKSAVGLEESLLHSNTYLTHITDGTSKHVVDTLQNLISENEIVKFLKDLQSEAKKLIREPKIKSALGVKVESAVLATKLVNLYCKIAILHSYVLWQVFCIKQIYGNDKSTTKVVFEMIEWCRNSNSEMLKCITHPKVDHAVFLGVFHISENENVQHLLQIQDIEVPAVAEHLYNREIHIQWSYSPDVALQMKKFSYGIWGTTETTTKKCKFVFEPVEGREMDDIFYIRSARSGWTDYYIQMKSDGTCETVQNRLGKGLKWKLLSLMSDPKNPNFIITSLDEPGRFLYLDSRRGEIRGKRDLEKVRVKGLWKIRDC